MRFAAGVLLCLALLAGAAAQKPAAGPKYDLATESKFKGVIDDIKEVPNSCLGDTCVHIFVKTGNGVVEVQVAPPEFLKFMEITFTKGDEVQVVGSKISANGNPLVLARLITRNNNDMSVRDDKGNPAWTWMKKGQ